MNQSPFQPNQPASSISTSTQQPAATGTGHGMGTRQGGVGEHPTPAGGRVGQVLSSGGGSGNGAPQPGATQDVAATAPSAAANGKAVPPASSKLAIELERFNKVAEQLRETLVPGSTFELRCQQAFDVANDLFGNAPTWVCFYRELMGGRGMIHLLFDNNDDFGRFLRTEQYHQIQLMLTALRSRDLPENDPNDPQRMITVRLPKSLHEAMCEEAGRLNISVNRLCISRMLQLLDPKMIPETHSKPRGRKPRVRSRQSS